MLGFPEFYFTIFIMLSESYICIQEVIEITFWLEGFHKGKDFYNVREWSCFARCKR